MEVQGGGGLSSSWYRPGLVNGVWQDGEDLIEEHVVRAHEGLRTRALEIMPRSSYVEPHKLAT